MTCATEPCAAVQFCPLVGGCVLKNFGPQVLHRHLVGVKDEGLPKGAPALNGTRSREAVHPSQKKSHRREIHRTGRK